MGSACEPRIFGVFKTVRKWAKWLLNGLVMVWSTKAFGTAGIMIFGIWRMGVYLQLGEWARWLVETSETVYEQVHSVQALRQKIVESYQEGEMDTGMTICSIVLMGFLLLSHMPSSKKREKHVDSGSDSDGSSGEAGH